MIFESILCYYIRCWLGLLLFLSSQNTLNLSKTGNFFLGLMNKLKSGETFPFPLSHLSFFWFLLFLCLIDFPSISYLSLCLSQQAKIVFVFIPATWEKSQRFHFQCQISEEGIPRNSSPVAQRLGSAFVTVTYVSLLQGNLWKEIHFRCFPPICISSYLS